MVFMSGKVGYPEGDCQAGISAEYSADGEDLLMGILGINFFRGKNVNRIS